MRDQGCSRRRDSTSCRISAQIADLEIGIAVPPTWADDVVIILDGGMESRHGDVQLGRTHTDSGWPGTTALGKVCHWETSPIRDIQWLVFKKSKAVEEGICTRFRTALYQKQDSGD